MQSIDRHCRIGGAFLALFAGASPVHARTPSYSYRPQVVIISIDGLRPDALSDTATPTLMGLARGGTYTLSALTVRPSETTPSHASMLSGYLPKVHGITWDGWKPEKGSIAVPTLLSVARQAGLHTVMIVGKYKLLHLAPRGGTFVNAASDDQVINEAMVWAGSAFDILVVHLPEVDLTGHDKGWMSTEYMNRVHATDRAVARLLPALPPSATILLTADHGGHGLDHGAEREQNMRIPWIITGPAIVAGQVLTAPVRTMDTAATAAEILGLILPGDIAGKVVRDAISSVPPYYPEIFGPIENNYLRRR